MDRYTEVLRNDPRNADALYYIAVVACQEGQYSQGIDLARRSLAFNPGQARAHNLIGQALHRQGKIKDALAAFDDAIACDINFAEAYGNRANMLSELGRPAEALTSFERAIALDPNSAVDWINRGATLHGLGRARRGDRELRPRPRVRPGLSGAPFEPRQCACGAGPRRRGARQLRPRADSGARFRAGPSWPRHGAESTVGGSMTPLLRPTRRQRSRPNCRCRKAAAPACWRRSDATMRRAQRKKRPPRLNARRTQGARRGRQAGLSSTFTAAPLMSHNILNACGGAARNFP